MSLEKVVRTFDGWARNGRDVGMEHGHGDVVEQVVRELGIRAGERILDLGCGNGWATRLLAQANAGDAGESRDDPLR
jgi:cyclopropane fatty-acyl-phospholipid synthase-like methyltransferase